MRAGKRLAGLVRLLGHACMARARACVRNVHAGLHASSGCGAMRGVVGRAGRHAGTQARCAGATGALAGCVMAPAALVPHPGSTGACCCGTRGWRGAAGSGGRGEAGQKYWAPFRQWCWAHWPTWLRQTAPFVLCGLCGGAGAGRFSVQQKLPIFTSHWQKRPNCKAKWLQQTTTAPRRATGAARRVQGRPMAMFAQHTPTPAPSAPTKQA